jgi:hypothetical protein
MFIGENMAKGQRHEDTPYVNAARREQLFLGDDGCLNGMSICNCRGISGTHIENVDSHIYHNDCNNTCKRRSREYLSWLTNFCNDLACQHLRKSEERLL